MHPLHDYVAKQLADKLRKRKVVVWYDPRSEFEAFVDELETAPDDRAVHASGGFPDLVKVRAGTVDVWVARYAGSFFELRASVEPLVASDLPEHVVIYVPSHERDRRGSVLMELEKAGTTWEPQLAQLARNVLLERYTLGVVDDLLTNDRHVSYEDLARAAAGRPGSEPPSILKGIFRDARGNDALLAAWIVSDAQDDEITSKDATRELVKLVRARLGLELPEHSSLSKLRAITSRYVLVGEFRLDLSGDPPVAIGGVPKPQSKDAELAVRELARVLRASFPDAYTDLADRVEEELGLRHAAITAERLGSIDTFRREVAAQALQ